MLRLTEVMGVSGAVDEGESSDAAASPPSSVRATATLTLTFGDRRRSRLLVRLDDGREAALMLPRGTVLREGDHLRAETGQPIVRVRSAVEILSVARTGDALLLSRAAYHLGNRHIPLQIGPGWLAYQHDHVLDDLARALGLTVTTESGPFEPEAGGYRHDGAAHHAGGDRQDGDQDRDQDGDRNREHDGGNEEGHDHPHHHQPHDPGHGHRH